MFVDGLTHILFRRSDEFIIGWFEDVATDSSRVSISLVSHGKSLRQKPWSAIERPCFCQPTITARKSGVKWISASWIRRLLAIVIILGVSFRFINLDGKVYWFDEVYTSMRAAGYTSRSVDQAIFQNQTLFPPDLQQFQRPQPGSQVRTTVHSLMIEDPQHPPLYFVMARWWMQQFGSSLTASRSLPALISLLSLPMIYILGRELFRSRLTAGLAVVLLAISPFDILFAQTARQYSLLTLAVIASSGLLWRALRRQGWGVWLSYALALTVGFYSHPLFVLTLVAQALYILLWSGQRDPLPEPSSSTRLTHWRSTLDWRTLGRASVAFLLCGLLYSPWMIVLYTNYQRATATTSWTKSQVGFLNLLKLWLLSFTSLFVDRDHGLEEPVNALLRLLVSVVIGVAFYQLVRHTPRQTWVFVVIITLVPFLLLAVPDLVLGGKRSAVSRYLIPCYPGVQLAVAYLLSQWLRRGRWWGQAVGVLLIGGAVVSVTTSTLAPTWWSKSMSYFNGSVADVVNASSLPLVSDRGNNYTNKGQLISMSYRLRSDLPLVLLSHPPDLNALPQTECWVYQPSDLLQTSLTTAGWNLELGYAPGGLWKAYPAPK